MGGMGDPIYPNYVGTPIRYLWFPDRYYPGTSYPIGSLETNTSEPHTLYTPTLEVGVYQVTGIGYVQDVGFTGICFLNIHTAPP